MLRNSLLRLALLAAALGIAAGGCAPRDASGPAAVDPGSIPNAFATSQAALMWPGATRAFQVRPNGTLYNGVWTVVPRCVSGGMEAGAPRGIAYEERWCPIVRWHRQAGTVRWEFEAVAFPAPAPADTELFVSLQIDARNAGSAAVACTLDCAISAALRRPGWLAIDAPPSGTAPPAWSAATGAPGAARETAADGAPHAAFTLAAGGRRTQRVLLAAYPTPLAALARAAGPSHARRVADARRHWSEATAGGLRLRLNDPELETAFRAARVVLLCCRERHAGHWLPTGGPFQYHDTWLRDGARAVAALSVAGHTREARELADGLTLFQWPQGAFLSQRGQLDGDGQALWAFAQAELRPSPDSTVARFAELAFNGADWVSTQRTLGLRAPWAFSTLLPFAEPRDAEMVRAQLVGNDAWALAGLASAARLLRAAKREADAARVDSVRAAYLADFTTALARLGTPDVPPSWQKAGLDWGNLAAGWPCLALPAGDPRLAATAERAWSRSAHAGLVSYGVPDSLHGYLGADLGTWALLAGRPGDAERALAALLHWRDATGAAAEVFSASSRDYGANLPPHPTSAAALVALTRNMLVYDDGDTLQLTLGARDAWWRGAHVTGAPTRWGALDLSFERHDGRAQWHWSAVPVWTALTLPAGTVLGARADAPLVGAPGGRAVLAPPGTTAAGVSLVPAAGARP